MKKNLKHFVFNKNPRHAVFRVSMLPISLVNFHESSSILHYNCMVNVNID